MASKKSNADTVEVEATVAPVRSVEDWAEAKGMLPRDVSTGMGPRVNPAYWKYEAAKAFMKQFMGWSGEQVTEALFDEAVRRQQEDLRFG